MLGTIAGCCILLPYMHYKIEKHLLSQIFEATKSKRPFDAYARCAEMVNKIAPTGVIELRFEPDQEGVKHRQMLAYYFTSASGGRLANGSSLYRQ